MKKKVIFLSVFFLILLSSCANKESIITQQIDPDYPDIAIKSEKAVSDHYSCSLYYPATEYESINKYISDYLTGLKNNFVQKSSSMVGFSELLTDYKVMYKTDSYLSLLLTSTTMPEKETKDVYMNFDLKQQQLLSIGDFLQEPASMQKLVDKTKKILSEKPAEKSIKDILLTELEASIENNQNFFLSGDSISINFPAGPNDPETNMPYTVCIPYEKLGGIFSDSFLKAMGITTLTPDINLLSTETDGEDTVLDQDGLYVALTFDDGPHIENTLNILETLAKYKAKATFYVIGKRVEMYPEVVKEAYDKGHEIGIHTWTHANLTKLTQMEVLNEIYQTAGLIASITGEAPKTLRPPYGAYNSLVQSIIDLPIVNWSVDTLDWKNRNTRSIIEIAKANTKNGSIILMHDIHKTSAEAVETIVRDLTEKGYQFVTVSELLGLSDPSEHAGTVFTHKRATQAH